MKQQEGAQIVRQGMEDRGVLHWLRECACYAALDEAGPVCSWRAAKRERLEPTPPTTARATGRTALLREQVQNGLPEFVNTVTFLRSGAKHVNFVRTTDDEGFPAWLRVGAVNPTAMYWDEVVSYVFDGPGEVVEVETS